MLELLNLSKCYKENNSDGFNLKNINLHFGNVGLVAIVGKSGSGKTTLLNAMSTLDKLSTGQIIVNGNIVGQDIDVNTYRKKCISFIFQRNNLFSNRNVYNNVILPLKINNMAVDKEKVSYILKSLGLNDLANKKVKKLSGGQEQRVAIARALIKDTPIIFADEPTANLDDMNSDKIFAILREIARTKLVILVSHDIERCYKNAERIIELEDGNVIKDIQRKVNDMNDLIEIDENGKINEDIIAELNAKKRKLAIGEEHKFSQTKISQDITVAKAIYAKSKKINFKNLLSLTFESIKGSKLKVVLMVAVCSLLIACTGLSVLVSSYEQSTATAISFSKNPTSELIIKQGKYDHYGNLTKEVGKLSEESLSYLKANYDADSLIIKNVSGLNISISGIENQELTPTSINGVIEITEQDLDLMEYKLMNFPYVDVNNPEMNSRFPLTGMPVPIEDGNTLMVNEVVITDYLAFVMYKEYFGIDLENLPETGDANKSKLEEFLHSGFEREFLKYQILYFLPNNLRVVGILDTGYKSKYLNILEGDYALTDYLFKEFVNEISGCHSYVYSGEGFASTCYTNNVNGEFQYVTTSSSIYNNYKNNGMITYIGDHNGILGEGEVLLDIQAFKQYTGETFDPNSTTPYKFHNSYDNVDFSNLKIVGAVDTRQSQEFVPYGLIVNQEFLKLIGENNSYNVGVRIKLDDNADIKSLFNYLEKNGMYAQIPNEQPITIVSNAINNLKSIFLPIMIILILLSILILGVFLCVNIIGKKYDNGIYRSFGASLLDTVKYLVFETITYLLLIVFLSTLLLYFFTAVVNEILLIAIGGYNVALFDGIVFLYSSSLPYIVLVLGTIGIGALLVVYPLIKISRISPTESIRRAD